MLMELNKPTEAFMTYQKTLNKTPHRFNSLYGACMAPEKPVIQQVQKCMANKF
jgi:hypothetical protein